MRDADLSDRVANPFVVVDDLFFSLCSLYNDANILGNDADYESDIEDIVADHGKSCWTHAEIYYTVTVSARISSW